jgi:hypothetical protein
VIAPLAPAQTSNVNPFSNALTILVEARLSGNRFYVFADPASLPVLEFAYLSSAPGPQLATDSWLDDTYGGANAGLAEVRWRG